MKKESYKEYRERLNSLQKGLGDETPYYNLRGAYRAKLEPELNEDGTYHLGSRNPKTGLLLKTPDHPTWDKLVEGEKQAGYEIYKKRNKYYSRPIDMKKVKKKKYKFGSKIEEFKENSPGGFEALQGGLGAIGALGELIPQNNLSSGAQKGIDIAKGVAKPLDMVIPGLGTGIGLLTDGIAGIVNKVKGKKRDPRYNEVFNTKTDNVTSNPFGNNSLNFKMGGKFYQLGGTKVSEFNAPSHSQGGQDIDQLMNPTDNGVGEIELKEVGVGNYIFSDFLKDKDGKTFASKAKKITRKYKDREDEISLNSLDKELSIISKRNEDAKSVYQNENSTKKFDTGGFFNSKSNSKSNSTKNVLEQAGIDLFKEQDFQTQLQIDKAPAPLHKMNLDMSSSQSLPSIQKDLTLRERRKALGKKTLDSKDLLSGIGYGLKGIQTLGHAAQAFQKPDLVDPIINPEANKMKSLAANRRIDLQPILNEMRLTENKAIKDISDNSLSDSVRRSNITNVLSNSQRNLANIKVQEQQLNNSFILDEINTLNSLGQQEVNSRVLAEDLNTKTKANVQIQRDKFLKDTLGSMSDHILQKDFVNKSNNFYANLLRQKYKDFGVNDPSEFSKKDVEIITFALSKGEDINKISQEYRTKTGRFKEEEE